MERVQVLIDKLVQQEKQGESAAQMLLTVQLLQQELLQLQQQSTPKPASKVAVVMPFAAVNVARAVEEKTEQKGFENVTEQPPVAEIKPVAIEAPVARPAAEVIPAVEPAVIETPAAEVPPQHLPYACTTQPDIKEKEEVKTPEVIEAPQKGFSEDLGYSIKRPQFTTHNEVKRVEETLQPAIVKEEEKTYFALTPTVDDEEHQPFDVVAETPTLVQHAVAEKDVNQKLSGQQLSLNDRLKQEQKEIAQKLVDTPIKDLRKAIGINDKFLFVDELFRGDDAMYERSIRTINNFHILPEAEYWINRELKVKLGWNDNKDTVQHFYHLVRRRFS